jgi:hypothetical protein
LIHGELMAESQDLGLHGERRAKRRKKCGQERSKDVEHVKASITRRTVTITAPGRMLYCARRFKHHNDFGFSRPTRITRVRIT